LNAVYAAERFEQIIKDAVSSIPHPSPIKVAERSAVPSTKSSTSAPAVAAVQSAATQKRRVDHNMHPPQVELNKHGEPKGTPWQSRKKKNKQHQQQQQKQNPPKKKKPFDMSHFRQRQIVLEFSYFGEKYWGLAAQDNTEETIERYLFDALKVRSGIKLPPENCNSSSWTRKQN
jgi:hypothetical protein